MFNIELPGPIGMVEGVENNGRPRIGPIIEEGKHPGGPFSTIHEYASLYIPTHTSFVDETSSRYMHWRIRNVVVEPSDNPNVDTDALIGRLCSLATRLCDNISSDELLAPRLLHGDPHDRNCLVDDGCFSGLVDWEVRGLTVYRCLIN